MRKLTENEMRTIDGGASAYVNCPICGQRVKVSILSRLFRKNSYLESMLYAEHGLLKNYGKRIVHKTV
jgi:hypothetical protein